MLGTEPIGRLVLKMTLPTVAAQIVNLLYVIVDRIFIGHIPETGDLALTGVGVVAPIITIVAAFSAFFGQGGAPIAAIALGHGDRSRAERILGNSVILLTLMSVVLTVTIALFSRPLLYLVGASDETFPYASRYLSIYIIGTLPVLLTLGLAPFVIAQGGSRLSMFATVTGCGTNIVLDLLLVRIFSLGVAGAAIATVISQTVSAALLLHYLLFRASTMRLRLRGLRLSLSVTLAIASLGISPFVMSSTESLIGFVMNSGLLRWGGDKYVGCLTVMQSVMQFIGVPVSGFTQGVTAVISYNYGAGNIDRVKKTSWVVLGVMTVFSVLVAGSAMIFPGFYARIFTDDAELTALTVRYLPMFISGMNIFGIQRCCQTIFLALKQAKISLFIALLRKVFLLVPLALVLPYRFGVAGVYMAEPIADTVAAITCGVIFLSVIKKILSRPAVS